MKFFNREPFDDQKVEAIRIQLTNLAANGDATDYQVFLDDMEVVPRTSNPELFASFYELISDKSRSLNIHVFSGASRHKRTYSFYFADEERPQGALGGADTQQIIAQQVAFNSMEIKLQHTEQQLKVCREEIVILENENERLTDENQSLKDDLQKTHSEGGMAANIFKGVEKVVMQLTASNANNQTLAGAGQNQPVQDGTVNISFAQFDQYRIFADMAQRFEKNQFDKVLHIIEFLSRNKPAIDETLDFLTEENPSNHDSQDDQY